MLHLWGMETLHFFINELAEVLADKLALKLETMKTEGRASMEQEPSKETYTLKEAAVYLGIEVQTLYNYNSKNIIPRYGKGKKVYLKRDLDKYLELTKTISKEEIEAEAQRLFEQPRRRGKGRNTGNN